MKKSLEAKLYKKYPKLFRQKDLPMSETAMCWNFQCDDGWWNLIDKTCAKIVKVDPEAEVNTVKEKFGTLRIYLDHANNEAQQIEWDVIDESSKVCEQCGKVGKTVVIDNWYFTVCKKHEKEILTKKKKEEEKWENEVKDMWFKWLKYTAKKKCAVLEPIEFKRWLATLKSDGFAAREAWDRYAVGDGKGEIK